MAAKVEHVTCCVCMKEIRKSEAMTPEATDYLVYICGLDCFEKWMHLDRKQQAEDIRRAVDDGMQDLRIKKPK